MNMSYDSSNLTTPDIKWLGVRPSDLDRFSIPQQCRLPMTDEVKQTPSLFSHPPRPPSPAISLPLRLGRAPLYFAADSSPSAPANPHQDIKTGQKLLEEDFIKSNPEFVKELEIMLASKEKAEIQVTRAHAGQKT